MPCRDDYSYEEKRAVEQQTNNKLTRLLCYVRHCTPVNVWTKLERDSAELTKWRIQHDAEDQVRIAKEEATAKAKKAKETALAKLSKADRIALGIHD